MTSEGLQCYTKYYE